MLRIIARPGAESMLRWSLRNKSTFAIPLGLDHGSDLSPPGQFRIKTFNKISEKGLGRFPKTNYAVSADYAKDNHAILLRSHKLQLSDVPVSCRCIARCGAGTNNIPVGEMTALGIPVFNTPGANANAVKELVLAGLFLSSRNIIGGVAHMKNLGAEGVAKERVEKDKEKFGGREITGKTLGVVGLGHIGSATARDAAALGMNVVGYDPGLTIPSALKLPRDIKLLGSMRAVFETADYVSLNIPYIAKPKAEGGTKGVVNSELLGAMKKDAVLLNFARGELVDSKDLKAWMDSAGCSGQYVTDFPDDEVWEHPRAVVIPHLGASTEEAEDAAAAMAAETLMRFLTSGEVVNSVNFPDTILEARDTERTVRIGVVNKNVPAVLTKILGVFGEYGLNIMQQVNKSRGDIAYNVIDIEMADGTNWAELQRKLTMIENVKSSRIIFGSSPLGGYGFAVNLPGKGYCV
jgi:D-3-phosphoglycerate dehydrogenase